MKVFIFDPLWPKLVDEKLKKALEKSDAEIYIIADVKPLAETPELFVGTEDRLLCLNPDYVNWKLTNDDYKDIPNLKGIFTASTGFEWIEKDVADERNIPICNIKDFSTEAVSEWAITMMFNLARQTPRLIKDGFPLDFDGDFEKYRGVQMKGKTVGIIGSAIAERAAGLGMNVVYWSRSSTNLKYKRVELDELMATADVIFPTVAKNGETLELINKDLISSMKSSAILVDIAHGLFDNQIALDMVKSGRLFGYGFEAEPQNFAKYEGNVWAAPAYGWVTFESMYNSEVKLVKNIVAAVVGKFPNRVN